MDVPLISTTHFKHLIHLFLDISADASQSVDIRTQAISFLMWSVMSHKQKISSLGLVPVIIAKMFPIGAEMDDGDDNDDEDEETPVRLAFQVIDSLSTSFPPQQVYPEVMSQVANYVKSSNVGDRKAAMLSIAVLTEGCADHIRSHLSELLEVVSGSMQDQAAIVRKSACMALCSLCDDLGDEVSEFHSQLLPLLFNLIQVKILE